MQQKKQEKKKESVGEVIRSLLLALILAMGVRTFLFDPFNIPSGSMKPGLLIGDFLFVSKYPYGYSNASFPFYPKLFSGRILDDKPKRGDVIVFKPPMAPHEDWIKRLIGLPGDVVQMREGILYINNEPCTLRREGNFVDHLKLEGYSRDENRVYLEKGDVIEQYIETLPGGVEHKIIKKDPFGQGSLDNTRAFTVPEGHYFVMGDNRDGSGDSRLEQSVGFIPHENLVGRAELIFFSTTARWWEVWKWPFGIRFKRLIKFIE
tara:strand:+ start:147 stop:935 length:789 start_codon:yes stop_codon:yes gene_type:complete